MYSDAHAFSIQWHEKFVERSMAINAPTTTITKLTNRSGAMCNFEISKTHICLMRRYMNCNPQRVLQMYAYLEFFSEISNSTLLFYSAFANHIVLLQVKQCRGWFNFNALYC